MRIDGAHCCSRKSKGIWKAGKKLEGESGVQNLFFPSNSTGDFGILCFFINT